MTFTIYRGTRPNGEDKIGCDEAYPNRPIQQDLTNYYIVEEHTDEMVASRREVHLQIENNLPVDRFPYHLRKVRGSKGGSNRSNQESFKTLSKNTWDNHTVEERKARCEAIRQGKLGVKATDAHKKACSDGSRIISDELAVEIRLDYETNKISMRGIGRKYGFSYRTARNILRREHGY